MVDRCLVFAGWCWWIATFPFRWFRRALLATFAALLSPQAAATIRSLERENEALRSQHAIDRLEIRQLTEVVNRNHKRTEAEAAMAIRSIAESALSQRGYARQ